MLRTIFTVLLICSIVSFGYAQDSLKKAAPVKTAPVKVLPNLKAYKHHYYYHHYKADSIAKAQAQQPGAVKADSVAPAPVVIDKSLNGQYQYLLTKVYHYQQPLISALWKTASDTLANNRRKLQAAQNKLAAQSKTIDSLNTQTSGKENSLARVDGVDIFGLLLSKTAYNLIVWGLVALFGIATFVVIARSGSFKREARYRTQLYTELEEEFKAYKTKANDKEKKLARELQTERNKLDELLGKG
ncbi:MAG: hypothetical protein ACHQIM_17755 [Sphingobacteriales bacterium]